MTYTQLPAQSSPPPPTHKDFKLYWFCTFFCFNGCCGLSWDIEEKENKFKTYPSSFKVINKLIFILQGQFVHLYSSFKVRLWDRLSMAEKKSKLVQIKFFIGSLVYIGYKRFKLVLIGSRLIVLVDSHPFSSVLIRSHRFSSVLISSRRFSSVLVGSCWFSLVLIGYCWFSSIHVSSCRFLCSCRF